MPSSEKSHFGLLSPCVRLPSVSILYNTCKHSQLKTRQDFPRFFTFLHFHPSFPTSVLTFMFLHVTRIYYRLVTTSKTFKRFCIVLPFQGLWMKFYNKFSFGMLARSLCFHFYNVRLQFLYLLCSVAYLRYERKTKHFHDESTRMESQFTCICILMSGAAH